MGNFLAKDGVEQFTKKGFTIPKKTYQIVKSEKYETFCVSSLSIWLQYWLSCVQKLA